MPKVSAEVARDREVRAWAMRCAGASQDAIATTLGITQQAVSLILRRVSSRLLKALEKDVEERKALHTARLEHIFSEAIGAWDESKKPRKKSSSKKTRVGLTPQQLVSLDDGKPFTGTAVDVREETRNEATTTDGNVAMLLAALQALADQAKLWGLNAAKKIDLLDKRRPLEKLTDEELQRRARENAALLGADA